MSFRLRLSSFFLIVLGCLLSAAPAAAQLYPYAEIHNNTPYTVSGTVVYVSAFCRDDDYTVRPGATWKATSRGSCLIKEITGKVPSGTRSLHGENTGVVTYTSSGTGYAKFQIEPFGDRYRIFSENEFAKVSKTDQRKSPGFYFVNETQWPVAFSLDQYSCLYHDVIPAQDQNGNPGIMARDTGAFWFTLRVHIQPDGKNPQTDMDCVEPVVELVADVALAALSGGTSAAASAARTGAKIAAKQVAKAAVKSATKKAVKKIAGNGIKQLGAYLTETGSVTLFGQFAGYEWPFRCDRMPEYHITGGPQVLIDEFGETYLMPGPAFTVRKTNTCGNDMMAASVKSASAKVDIPGFYTGTDEDDAATSGGGSGASSGGSSGASTIQGHTTVSNPAYTQAPLTTDGVNGRNLARADFNGGSFRQINQTAWNELNASGQVAFSFEETQRDDWSVYLTDNSRGALIVLDSHRKKVVYAAGGNPYSDLYDITQVYRIGQPQVSQGDPVLPAPTSNRPAAGNPTTTDSAKGDNLVIANFNGGSYRSEGGGRWTERNAGGAVTFNFEETGFDEWSVYLLDRSRNVRIQLDAFRKMIRYGDSNTAMRDQYQMTSALRNGTAPVAPPTPPPPSSNRPAAGSPTTTDGANGENMVIANFNGGSYRSEGGGRWTERNAGGAVTFNFEETGFDEWSVYLLDRSRNVRIQLDAFRKMILYGDSNTAMRDQYQMSAAMRNGSPAPKGPTASVAPVPSGPTPSARPGRGPDRQAEQGPDRRPQRAQDRVRDREQDLGPNRFGNGRQDNGPQDNGDVNGRNLSIANFNGGSYRSEGGGRWTERNTAGAVTFNFEETGRDDWSVYLLDRSRNVRIQLDVHRKKVLYGDSNTAMRDQYDITSVSAAAPGRGPSA